MKFLIAGLGSIGRRHLHNLLALGERDIILYRNRPVALPEDELDEFPTETSLDAALEHHPDAAIISNPTSLHLDVAIPAAQSGCHLLLEKPISHSIERIKDLQLAARRGGGQILVGFQFRFHPTLQIASRLLAEGAVGRPVSVRSHWGEYLPNWHPGEDYRQGYAARADLGGGVLLTLCHPLDYLSWLFGKPQLSWAYAGTMGDLEIPVDDIAEIGLRFPNGAIGSVHLDYIQQPATHHIEIIGTQGTLRWDNADGSLALYRHNHADWEHFMPSEGFERNRLFMDEMRHFIAVAHSEALPICTLDDGIHALKIATQALAFQARHAEDAPPSTATG
ncbi:MAG: Gfo/Idh/MocA family oxidoreductase [Kiritimatiellia bacterium]|jgi:predicted dehydrogenase